MCNGPTGRSIDNKTPLTKTMLKFGTASITAILSRYFTMDVTDIGSTTWNFPTSPRVWCILDHFGLWFMNLWILSISKKHGWWFHIFFYVHPDPWGSLPFWRAYFSNGVVQPPTRTLPTNLEVFFRSVIFHLGGWCAELFRHGPCHTRYWCWRTLLLSSRRIA